MAAPRDQPACPPNAVVLIVEEYLERCRMQRAAATYLWYRDQWQEFCRHVGSELTVASWRGMTGVGAESAERSPSVFCSRTTQRTGL